MSQDIPDLSSTTGTPAAAAPDARAPVVPAARPVTGAEAMDQRAGEPASTGVFARLGAEMLGTFFLVLAAIGITLYSGVTSAGTLGVALGSGIALMGAMFAFGHVSGGHFNPAVTLGSAIAGRTPWIEAILYWISQIVGGVLAAGVIFLTIPKSLPALVSPGSTEQKFFATTANGFGDLSPLATLSQGKASFEMLAAVVIEVIAVAVLVAVYLATTRRRSLQVVAPVAIGLTYAVLVLIASPITNAALNPARATAAAIFSGAPALGQLWLFWVAPLVGAALAALAYRTFGPDDDESLTAEELEAGRA
ncbi:aquaporin [Pengzhenrongella sp.]|jgi:aquaporin Z|uniref:aquaporin n=1 Tax=Pengzhenrongella sp. TaxID=2888820 RepID=UPI002F9333CA